MMMDAGLHSDTKRIMSYYRTNHLMRFSKRTPVEKRTSVWIFGSIMIMNKQVEFMEQNLNALQNEVEKK